MINQAFAHVGYVLPEETISQGSGSDFGFLLGALSDPFNLALMGGALALVLGFYFGIKRAPILIKKVTQIQEKTKSYQELIPWMLRLSLGIALIGSGVAHTFISPILSNFPSLSFLQIALGFLLLSGFLLTPVSWMAIILFLTALSKNFYIAGNLEFLAAGLSLAILANSKPGLDDLLGIPFFSPFKQLKKFVPLILRVGIGGAMMFLALYEKLFNPHLSELVIAKYQLTSAIPVSPQMWVLSAGSIEFLIGFLLCVGFRTRLFSAIAFLVLTLSFFYFGEAVYSHITLFGVLSALFVTGGGKLSFDLFAIAKKATKEKRL